MNELKNGWKHMIASEKIADTFEHENGKAYLDTDGKVYIEIYDESYADGITPKIIFTLPENFRPKQSLESKLYEAKFIVDNKFWEVKE